MDFNRNPLAVPGDAEFSLDRLDDDVRAYLANSGALLSEPIERLRQMNPLRSSSTSATNTTSRAIRSNSRSTTNI